MNQLLLIPRQSPTRQPLARPLARVLAELPLLVRDAVAVTVGTSRQGRGRGPRWLTEAAALRVEGLDLTQATHTGIILSVPPLGEVAAAAYRQRSLFPEMRPALTDNGLDVLGDCLRILSDQRAGDIPVPDSLCLRLLKLRTVVGSTSELAGFALATAGRVRAPLATVTSETLDAAAERLVKKTEEARAQVTGSLDLLDAERERFRLTLDSREHVWCHWPDRLLSALRLLWGRRVRVSGRGEFALRGRLLRVFVDRLDPVDPEDVRVMALARKYSQEQDAQGR